MDLYEVDRSGNYKISIYGLYQGDESVARGYFHEHPHNLDLLRWALSVKVGDYIGTCDGCNRKVVEITPHFAEVIDRGEGAHSRHAKAGYTEDDNGEYTTRVTEPGATDTGTLVLDEVEFENTLGGIHYCPAGGCAGPTESPEKVTQFFRSLASSAEYEERLKVWFDKEEEQLAEAKRKLEKMRLALASGQEIVDEHGELLPMFDDR